MLVRVCRGHELVPALAKHLRRGGLEQPGERGVDHHKPRLQIAHIDHRGGVINDALNLPMGCRQRRVGFEEFLGAFDHALFQRFMRLLEGILSPLALGQIRGDDAHAVCALHIQHAE